MSGGCPFNGDATRRGLLTAATGLFAAASAAQATERRRLEDSLNRDTRRLPFYGPHQNGIANPTQAHSYFASFDLIAQKRQDVAGLMRIWTEAAAKLTQGQPVGAFGEDPAAAPADSGEARDLPPSRLTLTFGLGPGLFVKDGADRYGLSKHRPAAFADLPHFVGDQLILERTGGDLSVQACADDPQTAFHAVRQLMRLADGVAKVRWVQTGFTAPSQNNATPRNLMGFKDGTMNVATRDPRAMAQHVWVGDEGEAWMRGGTYMVARPIRIALEHWDRMKLGFQEQTVGRHKASGAPIGGKHEFEPLNLDAKDADGNPVIAENAHVRLAAPDANDGAQILRRGYAYDNGVSFVAEHWPPWRQGMEFDAGLFFVCYQRDLRTGFIKIFDKMSKFDMLNQFVTPVGGGAFACPGGVAPGRYLAQDLFETV